MYELSNKNMTNFTNDIKIYKSNNGLCLSHKYMKIVVNEFYDI